MTHDMGLLQISLKPLRCKIGSEDQTIESVTMFGQSPTCLPKVSPLAAPDRVQPAAGGAVRLRPPQLRLRDPGGLRRQPPVRVEARPAPLCLHGVRTHISRYTHTVQIPVNRTSPCAHYL